MKPKHWDSHFFLIPKVARSDREPVLRMIDFWHDSYEQACAALHAAEERVRVLEARTTTLEGALDAIAGSDPSFWDAPRLVRRLRDIATDATLRDPESTS